MVIQACMLMQCSGSFVDTTVTASREIKIECELSAATQHLSQLGGGEGGGGFKDYLSSQQCHQGSKISVPH